MASKRPRGPNFLREDQILLCEIVENYTHIIENTKNDTARIAEKRKIWVEIAELFNSRTKNHHRSKKNLLSCYRNIKFKIKKEISDGLKQGTLSEEEYPLKIIRKRIYSKMKSRYAAQDGHNSQYIVPKKERMSIELDSNVSSHDEDDGINDVCEVNIMEEPSTSNINDLSDSSDIMEYLNSTSYSIQRTTNSYEHNTSINNVEENPPTLNDDKSLLRLQTQITTEKLREKKINTKLKQVELQHKEKMQQLELENLLKENEFREEMRKKEMLLINIKIQKASDSIIKL